MKRYRNIPGIVLLVIAMILMTNEQIPAWISLVILAVAAVLLIINARGNVYFSKAVKLFQSNGDPEKTKAYFEKALDAGVPDQYMIIAASVLLRSSMSVKAKDALEPIAAGSNEKRAAEAKTELSIYYWFSKDPEKAISLCESAKEGEGRKDRNVYVNLCTYYLGTGDVKKFRENLKEGLAIDPDSPALADFRAVSYILEGNYKAAGSLLTDLLEKATPAFADPYIHLAMVYLYYGEREKAQDALSKARETVFHITSIYSRDDVTRLGAAVDDDWQIMPAVNAIFSDTLSFINGKVPEWGKADEPCHEMEKTHNGLKLEEPASISYEDEEEKEDSDDVSTELSESDEEWIRRHS